MVALLNYVEKRRCTIAGITVLFSYLTTMLFRIPLDGGSLGPNWGGWPLYFSISSGQN